MTELHLNNTKIADILDFSSSAPKINLGELQFGSSKRLVYKGYFMSCSTVPDLTIGMGEHFYIVTPDGKTQIHIERIDTENDDGSCILLYHKFEETI